jgi:hypothetical protein
MEQVEPNHSGAANFEARTVKANMKTILTIITLITLLCAATVPAQESIQNQLNQIEQNQRDIEGAIGADQIQRQGEAWQAQYDREAAAEAKAQQQADQQQAWQNFKMCVDSGVSPSDCARIWLH